MRELRSVCVFLLSALVAVSSAAAELTDLAPGIYFREGDIKRGQGNGGYILCDDCVVAIDAPNPEASAEMLEEIRKLSDRPLRFLIITHGHWDHDGGVDVFVKKGVTVICHEKLRQRYLSQKKEGKIIGVRETHVLRTGKRAIRIFTLGTCHSTTDLFVHLPSAGILFTGDAVVNVPAMWMGECHLGNWIRGVGRLRELKPKRVCPGHGPSGGPEILARAHEYLVSLRDQVACQVCQGRTLETTLGQLAKPHREDYGRDYLVAVRRREKFARDGDAFAGHVKAAYRQLTAAPPRPPADGKPRALALIGDHYHPPEYIRPPLESALKSIAMPIEFVYDVTKLTAQNLKGYQLLIVLRDGIQWPDPSAKSFSKGSWWMTKEQEQAIVEFVRAGNGLLALHNATCLRPWGDLGPVSDYSRALGSRLARHGAADERFKVRVVNKGHPVTRGVNDYTAVDERHILETCADDITVLLEARSGDEDSVLGHVRREGKGRVCYLANGHNRQALELASVQRLIANAARWCCGIDK